jgi:hypothetical protein
MMKISRTRAVVSASEPAKTTTPAIIPAINTTRITAIMTKKDLFLFSLEDGSIYFPVYIDNYNIANIYIFIDKLA